MAQFLAVPPADWPQDQLRPPGVAARHMPPTSRANRDFVRREAAVFTLPITAFNSLGTEKPGGQVQATIPTDQDGDFWCESIWISAYRINATTFYGGPVGTLAFTDIRTGQTLTFGKGGTPLDFFALGINSTSGGAPPGTIFFTARTSPRAASFRNPLCSRARAESS